MSAVPTRTVIDALRTSGLLVSTHGALPDGVRSITDDSRAVVAGSLFLAVRGSDRDGHDYLDGAARDGAVAAVVDDPSRTTLPAIVVTDTRRAAAIASAAFHGEPAGERTLGGDLPGRRVQRHP